LNVKPLQIIFSLIILSFFFIACNSSEKNKDKLKGYEEEGNISARSSNQFLFLTEWFAKAGVYRYDLAKKKYKPVWWHPRENVVMLVYKSKDHPSFFFTADAIGVEANFPFFRRLKLFRIEKDFSGTKRIDNLGSGLQFTARWNEDENLEVIFTFIDKTIPSYINKYTKVFDQYGKLINSDIETFDIEKKGFPELMPERNSALSPSGKFGISIKTDSIFFKTAGNDSLYFISTMKHSLNKIRWNDDEKYLVISTLNLNDESIKTKNPETSELFVYSIEKDSLVTSFGGAGVKNFFTTDDLVIFDDGFDKNSVINIYDLMQRKIVDVIEPREGCGLVYIPMYPAR
jgi:hypothetical protein